jgi:hypothetical protein
MMTKMNQHLVWQMGMELPQTVDLSFLKTLHIITSPRCDGRSSIKGLISRYPCILELMLDHLTTLSIDKCLRRFVHRCRHNLKSVADLTLEGIDRLTGVSVIDKLLRRFSRRCCHNLKSVVVLSLEVIDRLTRVSVIDKRLCRFALRCCHNLKSVDTSELRLLDNRGMVPTELIMYLDGYPVDIPSCTINICKVPSKAEEHYGFIRFMEKISSAKYLHLHHRCLWCRSFEGFPSCPFLTRLVLQSGERGAGAGTKPEHPLVFSFSSSWSPTTSCLPMRQASRSRACRVR